MKAKRRLSWLIAVAFAATAVQSTSWATDRSWSKTGSTPGNWNSFTNWSPFAVAPPGPTDNVTIAAKIGAPPIIPYVDLAPVEKTTGDTTIQRLTLTGTLSILGGSIAVTTGGSTSTGALTVGNGSDLAAFKVTGPGTTFVANTGQVHLNGGDLIANGSQLILGAANSIKGRSGGLTAIDSVSSGSIVLTGVTEISGDPDSLMLLRASQGSSIDLRSVSEPVTGNVLFLSLDPSSLLNLPATGSGWNMQVLAGGGIELTGNGNAEYTNSTIALQDGDIFLGNDPTRLFTVGKNSQLQVVAALPGGQNSVVWGDLANHGNIDLGPFSVLFAQSGFHQYSDGQFTIHLADPLPAFPSEQGPILTVLNGLGKITELAGNLTIDGNQLSDPGLGDYWVILNTESTIVGEFATVTGMRQANGIYLVPFIGHETGIVELAATLGGDADRNGFVDGADYTVWADHYLQTGKTWKTGDFNGDGFVDGGDYTIWADNYAPAPLALSAVPEPSALALAGIGGLALLICARYRPTTC